MFVGGFSIEAAEAVTDLDGGASVDVLDGLAALADSASSSAGRATASRGSACWRRSASTRLRRSGATPDLAEVRARHAAHYAAIAEEMAPGLLGRRQRTCTGWMLREADNLRAALDWALEQASGATTARLMTALRTHLIAQGRGVEGVAWARRAAAQARRIDWGPDRAAILHAAGWLLIDFGDFEGAVGLFGESAAIYREIGREAEAGASEVLVGLGRAGLGQVAEGTQMVLDALPLCRRHGDRSEVAVALSALGEIARAMGRREEARARFEESLALLPDSREPLPPRPDSS